MKEEIEQTDWSFEKVVGKLHSRPSNVGEMHDSMQVLFEVAGPPRRCSK